MHWLENIIQKTSCKKASEVLIRCCTCWVERSLRQMYKVPGLEWFLLPSPRSSSRSGWGRSRSLRLSWFIADVAIAMSGIVSLRALSLQGLGSFWKKQARIKKLISLLCMTITPMAWHIANSYSDIQATDNILKFITDSAHNLQSSPATKPKRQYHLCYIK